jgi:hypothetical protein
MSEATQTEHLAGELARQLADLLSGKRISAWATETDGYLVIVSKRGDEAASSYARGVITGEQDLAAKLSDKVPPDVFHDPSQQSDG